MSGLARAYAVTGSEPTRAKVSRLVKGYADTLDDKAIFFKGYRLPAYTYDKLSCGLIDAYEFAKDPLAPHEGLAFTALASCHSPAERPATYLRWARIPRQVSDSPPSCLAM